MSFSPHVLANIKTIAESEDECDATGVALLEVMNDFPNSSELAEVCAEEPGALDDMKMEHCQDPLLGCVETFLRTGFPAEYKEQDFMNEHSDYDDAAEMGPSCHKKARNTTEFKGRNGHVWLTTKPTTQEPIADVNMQQMQPKGKGPANKVSNPLEAWHLLMDERILTQIITHTNEAIRLRKGKLYYERPTDPIEFRAWLGLNYLCGIFRNASQNGPLDELWSLELGNAIFRATMTVKRFEFLANSLRFSLATKSNKKGMSSDFTQVQDIWEKFLINCRSYYAPSGNCTIDEHIMRGTKTKNGVKILSLCDAKTLYMCNAINVDGVHHEQDVLRLVSDIKGTKRNIVVPEYYTSVDLADKLMQYQLALVGTISPNAKEIPLDLLSAQATQKVYSGAAALMPMENGSGFLLTSGISGKINAEKLHHLSCDACQHFQESANAYSTVHATPPNSERWSLTFFHQLLDYAAVNAWVLLRLSAKGEGTTVQRDFQRLLGLYLTQQLLKRQLHANNTRLTLPQKMQICEVLGEPTDKLLTAATSNAKKTVSAGTLPTDKMKLPEGVTLLPKLMEKRARCRKCKGPNSPKTKTRCQQCLRPLCQRHFVVRCKDCTGVEDTKPDEFEEPEENDDSS